MNFSGKTYGYLWSYSSLFAQGLKNGVAPKVKMAVVGDIGAAVQNISGMTDSVDSMDGSGFTSPYFLDNKMYL